MARQRARQSIAAMTDVRRRERLVSRIERITELPLMLLAFLMVPAVLGPWLWDVSGTEAAAFAAIDVVVWTAFAVDLGVKLTVAPHRVRYLRSNWLEAAIVVMPLFRPLLAIRVAFYGTRAAMGLRRLARMDSFVVFGAGLVLVSATVAFAAEEGVNPELTSFLDALYWALVTMSTVGYGDVVPVTPAGKVAAVLLMTGGIAFFGVVAANLATLLSRSEVRETAHDIDEVLREVRALRAEIAELRTKREEPGLPEAPETP